MLEIKICDIKLKNPTMLAAGVMGSTASSLNWVYRSGAGAVVTKSFSSQPNKGYNNPTTVEVEGGIINAIGLSNPGVETFKKELKRLDPQVKVAASIYGVSPEEFAEVASQVEKKVNLLELNVSCPHAMGGCGAAIGQDAELTFEVVKAVKKSVSIPVITKLTPNVTDLIEIAISAVDAGSDALTLINSLGPGLKIDLETSRPVLSNQIGGMSGPAIKPIALRCVYEVFKAVEIPIIGVGGISNYQDVVEFLFAGASAVQVGTAIMHYGPEIFNEIAVGLEKFMIKKGFSQVDDMVGISHKI
ncbi:dihydroorotate dehydrogenase [Methanobacterium movens]